MFVSTPYVGGGPDGIGIDPNTNRAYVTNSKDNTIAVIDLKTNTVEAKLSPVGLDQTPLDHPEGVSIDPTTSKAYVANFDDNTVSVIKLHGQG